MRRWGASLYIQESGSCVRWSGPTLNGFLQSASSQFSCPNPGTPRGLGASNKDKLKPVIDTVHGAALGVAALLVAANRLPLGVPSRLPAAALELAERLILHPEATVVTGWAVEREAGYILLGALCFSLSSDVIKVILEESARIVTPSVLTVGELHRVFLEVFKFLYGVDCFDKYSPTARSGAIQGCGVWLYMCSIL